MRANQMLRHLIKQQGREIQWLGSIIGADAPRMSRIVNGRHDIDAIVASRIAGALGVPLLFAFDASTEAEKASVESMPDMEATAA